MLDKWGKKRHSKRFRKTAFGELSSTHLLLQLFLAICCLSKVHTDLLLGGFIFFFENHFKTIHHDPIVR